MMTKSTFTMACMLLTVGCTGLQTNGNKNESKKKDNFSNNNNGNENITIEIVGNNGKEEKVTNTQIENSTNERGDTENIEISATEDLENSNSNNELNQKIDNLKVTKLFDENNKMNLSLKDVNGELLVVSNFTIYGNTKKGRRPSYTDSAPAEKAYKIYDLFLKKLEKVDTRIETGEFGEYMKIVSENDGPVNLIIDSQ